MDGIVVDLKMPEVDTGSMRKKLETVKKDHSPSSEALDTADRTVSGGRSRTAMHVYDS
jgi:hypothetical protein